MTQSNVVRLIAAGLLTSIVWAQAPLPATVPGTVAGSAAGGFPANQTVSGCGVEYTSGLSFTVGACQYTIAGAVYNSPQATVTLAAADPTNPRIDVIGVDVTSSVITITGTPAASPAQPSIDPSTQLGLIFVSVAANATTPTGIVATTLYDENTEWTCTPTAHINCASTVNPYHLTTDIEATAAVLGNNFTLVKPAAGTVNLATQNTLVFYIRSKAAWPTGASGTTAARFLSLFWKNGSTQVGTAIVVRDGTFGFASAVTTNYQQISIPVTLFGTGSNLVTTLQAQISGPSGSSSIGWYIDEVTLQSGTGGITPPTTVDCTAITAGVLTKISAGIPTCGQTGVLASAFVVTDESCTQGGTCPNFAALTTPDSLPFTCAVVCSVDINFFAYTYTVGGSAANYVGIFIDGSQVDDGAQVVVDTAASTPITIFGVWRAASLAACAPQVNCHTAVIKYKTSGFTAHYRERHFQVLLSP